MIKAFSRFLVNTILRLALTLSTVSVCSGYVYTGTNDLFQSCTEVHENIELMQQSITKGLFRYSNTVSATDLPSFNYAIDHSYQSYLNYAYQLIQLKNLQSQRSCANNSTRYKILIDQQQRPEKAQVVDLIAPFELKQENNNKAILLIHGLTDSPFLFDDLATFFHQQGFTVRTLLLPGHGTAASDLISVNLADWQQATQYAIERTLLDFKQVYLGGYSAGGALIFDYLLAREKVAEHLEGLIMWAPATQAKSELAWLSPYLAKVPFFDWLDKGADLDFAKYESFPINAAAQVERLMANISITKSDQQHHFHNIPLFIAASDVDQTINSQASIAFANQWNKVKQNKNGKSDRFVFYGDDKAQQAVQAKLSKNIHLNLPQCSKGLLCDNSLDISHIAITSAPENFHYGVMSSYRNCSHYLNDTAQYLSCKKQKNLPSGEITPENLSETKLMKRLTYNPYYTQMLEQLVFFIEQKSSH